MKNKEVTPSSLIAIIFPQDSVTKVPHEILLDQGAKRDLDDLSERDLKRVNKKISSLGFNPRPRKTRKLDDAVFRMRSGNWRIIYVVDDKARKVIISRIKRRNEKTYRNH